jgi:quercetin dioxygenase-like cupin family protein
VSRAVSIDVADLDLDGPSGALWSLPHDGDLDANVVLLQPGDSVGAHVNGEVDVLVVGIAGTGEVVVDGDPQPLGPASLVHVPKGATRGVAAGGGAPLVYVTVHRARAGLAVGSRPHR